jgi:hypothetical protein
MEGQILVSAATADLVETTCRKELVSAPSERTG